MGVQHSSVIDQGLMSHLSDLLLCSGCLSRGVKTRVAQLISPRHRPRSLCPACRASQGKPGPAAVPVALHTARRRG